MAHNFQFCNDVLHIPIARHPLTQVYKAKLRLT